jgi:hypothetical protein
LLSRGEITRRFALAGIEATKNPAEEDMKRRPDELRSSEHVAAPEGDKAQGKPVLTCQPNAVATDEGGTAEGRVALDAGTDVTGGATGRMPMADGEAECRGISRRLLLEYFLWAESERGLVESVRTSV